MGLYVCLLIARDRYTNLHQTWLAYALKPGRDFRKVERLSRFRVLLKVVPVARKLNERRTEPKPTLLVLARILQEQRPQPQKIILGSSPDGDAFSS
jgi:hypothetical protein